MASIGLGDVLERIGDAAARSGRNLEDVTLVAVSKGRRNDAILLAYGDGQRVFGENRQQGLAARIASDLPPDIEWHFIGPLQGRKASYVSEHVSLLHSFDRLDLIGRWKLTSTPVLVQFNMAGEQQKGGFDPNDADRTLDAILEAGISVRGVMAIPPVTDDASETRRWFVGLKAIFDRFQQASDDVDTLSMGMSNDFEVAIEEGATMVRVGTAIFGPAEQYSDRNG